MTSFVNSGGVDSGMDLLVILLGRNVSATFMLLKTWGGGNDVSIHLPQKRGRREAMSPQRNQKITVMVPSKSGTIPLKLTCHFFSHLHFLTLLLRLSV